MQQLIITEKPKTLTGILCPLDNNADRNKLQEVVGLTKAIDDVEVIFERTTVLRKINPAYYVGSGILEELKEAVENDNLQLVVVDTSLSPIQHRNLERRLQCKVIDRTALILEIFGSRARTHEGKLQVELAALTFQRSRLVRSWTHLERQRGGAGFLGGPGERQIELDRRIIDDKIVRLKKQLEDVRRTRGLHRQNRQEPVIALVGYTNAGKSTLFNHLTQANVMAKDLLFATLDPTMRPMQLHKNMKVVLSDTVGFIANLPTTLIAAFQATLEEVLAADVILHVRDISHPETEQQRRDVLKTLAEIGLEDVAAQPNYIEVWNKIDLLETDNPYYHRLDDLPSKTVAISALKETNEETLKQSLLETVIHDWALEETFIPFSDGQAMAKIHQNTFVLEEKTEETGTYFKFKRQIL